MLLQGRIWSTFLESKHAISIGDQVEWLFSCHFCCSAVISASRGSRITSGKSCCNSKPGPKKPTKVTWTLSKCNGLIWLGHLFRCGLLRKLFGGWIPKLWERLELTKRLPHLHVLKFIHTDKHFPEKTRHTNWPRWTNAIIITCTLNN